MEFLIELVKNNPYIASAIAAILFETGVGMLPDRWIPYIGGIRYVLKKVAERKAEKISVVLIALLFLFAGCASLQTSNVCDTDQPSRICERIPRPENKDLALQIVNARLLKKDVYTVNQALDFLDRCEAYIDGAATYADVVKWVASELDEVDIEVLILSNYLDVLRIEAPIYDYDRMLLKEHIENQREVLQLYTER